MFCPICGKEQADGSKSCSKCGASFVQKTSEESGGSYTAIIEYAGFWKRLLAFIIDTVLLWVVQMIITLILALVIDSAGVAYMVFSMALQITISWLYYAIQESSSSQATIGKRALGIIVTDLGGKRISFGRATGRYFAKIISGLILLIGYIMIAFTKKKQGLHDIIADTLVVSK